MTKAMIRDQFLGVTCAKTNIRKHYISFSLCIILGTLSSPCKAEEFPKCDITRLGARNTPLSTFAIPNIFCVNIHFSDEPNDLDLIADAGFKFIRMDLTWEAIEKKKGAYEFEKTGYDTLTQGCFRR